MKNLKKLPLLLALLLLLALTFTGCDSVSSILDDAGKAIGDAVGDATKSDEDAEVEKHNAYIDLYNDLVDDFYRVINDYGDEFGWETEIYIEDGFNGFSMYSTSAGEYLETALPYADKAPAHAGADAALKKLAAPLKTYCKALSDANAYYEAKGYVDDKYAKAQEYHTVIVGEIDALDVLIGDFLTEVDDMLEGQTEEQLAKYKAENQMIHYYGLLCVDLGQTMSNYLYDNDIWAENISDLDAAGFRVIYDEFTAAYNEYQALVGNDSDAGEDEGIMTLSSFNGDLTDLKASAAELVSRVESGKEFSSSEISIAHMTDGTPENISRLTSSLLSGYNAWFV